MNDLVANPSLNQADLFERLDRWAQPLAQSQLTPESFRNKPADCIIALLAAEQLGLPGLMVIQNMYIVKGTPSWKAQFVIALAQRSGLFIGSPNWETTGAGDAMVVTCRWKLKDGQTATATASMEMAIAEKWGATTGKYKSMPEHMLRYRSATFLVRQYAPAALMGFRTDHEVEDQLPEEPEIVIAREAATGAARIAEVDATEADKAEAAKLANSIRGGFLRGKSAEWMRSFGVRHGINGRKLEQLSTAELSAIIRIEQEAAAPPVQDAEIVEEGGEE